MSLHTINGNGVGYRIARTISTLKACRGEFLCGLRGYVPVSKLSMLSQLAEGEEGR